MDKLVIEGGVHLSGTISVQGAKNAALPLLAATLLSSETCMLRNVPDLLDVQVMLGLLRELGCTTIRQADTVVIEPTHVQSERLSPALMRRMRSSLFLLGPLLARFGHVYISQPGGCAIGERKIDLHLHGLERLGARVEQQADGYFVYSPNRLVGAEINLSYPSVGATENVMMAAATAKGTTIIRNAAREPEIYDLQLALNAMGAQLIGAGTSTISIQGVDALHGFDHTVMPDRIVAGTIMIATAATRGQVTLTNVHPGHLTTVIHLLRRAGVHIVTDDDIIQVGCHARTRPFYRLETAPYPDVPTDLQAPLMVLGSLADGESLIRETVFEGRFRHVPELCRMGAHIRTFQQTAVVRGVTRLYGATVEATDLRAGAALVIAGLAAQGHTSIEQIHHIDRGYASIERLFSNLGGRIRRISEQNERFEVDRQQIQT